MHTTEQSADSLTQSAFTTIQWTSLRQFFDVRPPPKLHVDRRFFFRIILFCSLSANPHATSDVCNTQGDFVSGSWKEKLEDSSARGENNSAWCGTRHIHCTPSCPLYPVHRCAGTNENTTKLGTIPSLMCFSFVSCVVFWSKVLRPVEGSEVETSPVTFQEAVLLVVGACVRDECDTERSGCLDMLVPRNRDLDSGRWTHETDTRMQGYQEVAQMSCACSHPVHSSVELHGHAHLSPTMNVNTDASTWLKETGCTQTVVIT